MAVEQLLSSRIEKRRVFGNTPEKLLSREKACEFVRLAHDAGKSVILVQGTWDLSHAGHVQHIREAKKYADLVLLRLASPEYAVNYKGSGRPIEVFRDMVVSEFENIDAVMVDDTLVSPTDIAENAHILSQLGVDKIAIEAEDDKFLVKFQSTIYANRNLGSHIEPVVLLLPHINSTTAIVNKIRNQHGAIDK